MYLWTTITLSINCLNILGWFSFSQVLETFCRLAVEARIVNCKLRTNNNLGCASEDWFPKYKGQELLDFVRSQKTEVIDKVVEVLESEKTNEFTTAPITVILNAYRRPYNLKCRLMQLETNNQTSTDLVMGKSNTRITWI